MRKGVCQATRLVKLPIVTVFLLLAMAVQPVLAKDRKFPLATFDNTTCRAAARSQDCPTPVMKDILTRGKSSIPVLISQLTDTERTPKPIMEQWSYTDSGDVAYVILVSLFTTHDGDFTLPGVPTWKNVLKGCSAAVESCWRAYLDKNGRASVQQAWQKAWASGKGKISWDAKERCFRVAGVDADDDRKKSGK